jgi:hypothetical protein
MTNVGLFFLLFFLPFPLLGVARMAAYQRMRACINRHLEPDSRVPLFGTSPDTRWLVTVSYDELHPTGFWSRLDMGCQLTAAAWPLVSGVAVIVALILRATGVWQ